MTNRILQVLIVFLLIGTSTVFGQEENNAKDPLMNESVQKEQPRVFPQFFFGWSYIDPLGAYGKGKNVDFADGTSEQFRGMELGLGFELGYIYWLNHINFASDKIKLGVKTVYFSPEFTFKNTYNLDKADFNNSFKVGPTFAYNPSGYLVIEGSIVAGPSLFYNGYWKNVNLLFNYGAELTIRFRPIYVGVGVTFGKYKFNATHLKDQFEIQTTRLGITFGFNF